MSFRRRRCLVMRGQKSDFIMELMRVSCVGVGRGTDVWLGKKWIKNRFYHLCASVINVFCLSVLQCWWVQMFTADLHYSSGSFNVCSPAIASLHLIYSHANAMKTRYSWKNKKMKWDDDGKNIKVVLVFSKKQIFFFFMDVSSCSWNLKPFFFLFWCSLVNLPQCTVTFIPCIRLGLALVIRFNNNNVCMQRQRQAHLFKTFFYVKHFEFAHPLWKLALLRMCFT